MNNPHKTSITCPSCATVFNLEDVLTEDIEKSIREGYEARNREIIEAFAKKENELLKMKEDFEQKKKKENELFADKLSKELERLGKEKEAELTKKISGEQQAKLEFLEAQRKEQEEKLKLLNQRELDVLHLKKALQDQQEEETHKLNKLRLELETELKERLTLDIVAKAQEKHDLEKRELEKQLNDQKRLTEQMTRKLEQGSMQTQGEVQELALQEILQQAFPYDVVQEVPKGITGADCILIVRNEFGKECGKIVFESKRAKAFGKEWIPKLKSDALLVKADISILVTQVLPDDIRNFDQKDGVWICKFGEVVSLIKVLREGIMNVARAQQSQENKGEKKEMLYNYFTSNEFTQQMRAINEAYLYLKSSIDKERFQMEKLWKEREKQIDKVLLNNHHLLGTIKGIAGNDIEDQGLLE